MTLKASKCHLLVSCYKDELMFATVGDALIWEEVSAKLLGIIIDSSLTFNDHVKMICKKASQIQTGVSRMSTFMCFYQRNIEKSYTCDAYEVLQLCMTFVLKHVGLSHN